MCFFRKIPTTTTNVDSGVFNGTRKETSVFRLKGKRTKPIKGGVLSKRYRHYLIKPLETFGLLLFYVFYIYRIPTTIRQKGSSRRAKNYRSIPGLTTVVVLFSKNLKYE